MGDVRKFSKNVNRVVVKVGTSTLTDNETGYLNDEVLNKLTEKLSELKRKEKIDVVLVSSGAVGAGLKELEGYGETFKRPLSDEDKQLAAAAGQPILMEEYKKRFNKCGFAVAQTLVTATDFEDAEHKENIAKFFNNALKRPYLIPIVNENDSVAIKELGIGDNDNLSAMVAKKINADLLIILSDIEGLYTKDPNDYNDAKLISQVDDISEVEDFAGGAGSQNGTGGMYTKIEAAKYATGVGIPMIVASGDNICNLSAIIKGKNIGTYFSAKPNSFEIDDKEKRNTAQFIKNVDDLNDKLEERHLKTKTI